MKDDKLAESLEELAVSLGVKVNSEKIKKHTARQPKGGLCVVNGEPRIIVHRPLAASERVQVLIESLQGYDLENVYMAPEVRQAIEGALPLFQSGDSYEQDADIRAYNSRKHSFWKRHPK